MTATLLFTLLPTRTTDRAELLDPRAVDRVCCACSQPFLAHFAPFNIGGRCVRLWRVQENNDRRLIAHRTWTVVDPMRTLDA
jgi:hypothetical protein